MTSSPPSSACSNIIDERVEAETEAELEIDILRTGNEENFPSEFMGSCSSPSSIITIKQSWPSYGMGCIV